MASSAPPAIRFLRPACSGSSLKWSALLIYMDSLVAGGVGVRAGERARRIGKLAHR